MPSQSSRSQLCHLASLLLLCLWTLGNTVNAFTMAPIPTGRPLSRRTAVQVANEAEMAIGDDDDEEDYEILEYESLTEAEFVKSEWLVGTIMDNNPNKIQETWVRLITDENGKNVAYWGDDSEGKWALDQASQFLSISKESVFGKQIWACTVEDFYYLSGTVRGWTYWAAAAVLGQWQAKRLGVDPDEAGVAPWFEEEDVQGEVSETGMEPMA